MTDWDRRHFELAEHIATWSHDPSTKVGAVVVGRDRRKVAFGYNGFPPGIRDDARLLDRSVKYRLTQHAERNALDNTHFDLTGGTLIVTMFPCEECAKSIVSKGIVRVVCPPPIDREPWATSCGWTRLLFAEAGIVIDERTLSGAVKI